MKYYIVAGEASGDLHASNLMKALKQEDANADFRFFGGELMEAVGGTMVKHYRELAFMGIIPVLLNLKTILRNLRLCKEDIEMFMPDVVILVDYPGFNLKVAKHVKTKLNIPVYYYISPKIWAWKEYRIKQFRAYVDKMFCILPFEVDYFKRKNYPVTYVGNPSMDSVEEYKRKAIPKETFISSNNLTEKPILAILAGSRKQEIKANLPTMLSVAKRFPNHQAVIAGAPSIDKAFYETFITDNVHLVFGQTYPLLSHSTAALVTSGTATLETALFRVPQVVCYEMPMPHLVRFIFNHFFTLRFISLVNLIADKEIVQELLADRFSEENIYKELDRLLSDNTYRTDMLKGYEEVFSLLGKNGTANRAAQAMIACLRG